MTDLYQKDVLRHAAMARGAGRLTNPDGTITLDNPLCGDRVTIDVRVDQGAIQEIAQDVKACVLCQASASILCTHATGATASDLDTIRTQLTAMLKDGADAPVGIWESLKVFEPVASHKSRHVCVLLPFEAVAEALRLAAQRT